IRVFTVTGVQTCALPTCHGSPITLRLGHTTGLLHLGHGTGGHGTWGPGTWGHGTWGARPGEHRTWLRWVAAEVPARIVRRHRRRSEERRVGNGGRAWR